MKVLLIYPPITISNLDISTPSKTPLIGLAYIAAVLQNNGHQVQILDCLTSTDYRQIIDSDFTRSGLSDSEILETIKLFKPDVVGISCMYTSYFKDAHNVAKIVKEYNKNILVIFGGAHASTFPETTMKDNNVDVTVIGEGEITICELLKRYQEGKDFNALKGIIHRVAGEVKKEQPRDFIENLDSLPFPAWELLEKDLEILKQEARKSKFQMRTPIGFILTSRGCPHQCYFCSVKLIWSRKWRSRSAKNIVDEIEFLKHKYGYREFHFVDDNCAVSKSRMHQLCDELLNRSLDVKLATPAGIAVATLDEEIMRKMKKAGFYRFCFGIESGDPETQKIIKKRIDLDKAKKIIAQANKLGFWTSATFIIGFPHETIKEIMATLNFARDSNMDFAIFYLLTPLPKTEVYDILKQQGLIDLDSYIDPHSNDWSRVAVTYCNGCATMSFSVEQLQVFLSKFYKEFLLYKLFSLQTYVNTVRKIKSAEDLRYMLRLITVPLKMVMTMVLNKSLSNISIHRSNKELKIVKSL